MERRSLLASLLGYPYLVSMTTVTFRDIYVDASNRSHESVSLMRLALDS